MNEDEIIIAAGKKLICPLCDKEGDSPVEDYTVPGRADGIPNEDQCGWCDARLTITQLNKGTEFRVEAEEADDED